MLRSMCSRVTVSRRTKGRHQSGLLAAYTKLILISPDGTQSVLINQTGMVGGTDEGFARAEPILAKMGKAVIHAGGAGAGQGAKICNNMLLGASMIATCESLALAQKLGLDPQTFFDIASVSSGQCWSLTSYAPLPGVGPATPADNDYKGGFAAALMLKDLRLAMEAAASVDADVPMGSRARELYEAFVAADPDHRDFSAIIQTLQK